MGCGDRSTAEAGKETCGVPSHEGGVPLRIADFEPHDAVRAGVGIHVDLAVVPDLNADGPELEGLGVRL